MIDELEAALWQQPENDERLHAYQDYFRTREQEPSATESRHHFIIVIPVADRPQHLEACLGSTLTLCQRFGYGGIRDGYYHKVEVVIADDSREPDNIAHHQAIAGKYEQRGLHCHYFGQTEQLAQLDKLDSDQRNRLVPIIGDTPAAHFYHKGASLMRNICYLKLQEMTAGRDDCLIYFIDSDQEFQVALQTAAGERNRYAISYLHQLDRLFREREITILTGKVVGDPPVSPAVMAGNFIDDVHAFLATMADTDGSEHCSFHATPAQHCDDAAYHDMAELFGFKAPSHSFDYHCVLTGEHDHAACLADFAARLQRFFDGEHPTRKSYYQHQPLDQSVAAARTIYTGNYCFRAAALRYFIPFAGLKLRMAGPVLGRIIKAELGERFVSANLPMLHKRTVETLGRSEFRPGVNHTQHTVDLAGEYERQFFGDVMLFTMEQLTAQCYPTTPLTRQQVEATVTEVEQQMLHNYQIKHLQVVENILTLRQRFEDEKGWWHSNDSLGEARQQFRHFIANMEANFGDGAAGYQQTRDPRHRAQRRAQITDAILGYPEQRALWQQLLDTGTTAT